MKKNNLHNVTSSGFKTPNNYFESFEADLFDRLNEKEEFNFSENAGFTVPKDYFDTVENNVLEKLNESSEKPVISLKSKNTFYYVAGIAASFIILVGLVFNNDRISLENIDTVLIENYLYQQEYSNDDFASMFKTSDISETDFIDIHISDETLNQYYENIEPEDLIFE